MKKILLALMLVPFMACQERSSGDSFTGPGIEISVAPLSFDEITDVVWTVKVTAGADTVWERELRSSVMGNGAGGSISYVGPCDATQSPNRVILTLDKIEGSDGNDIGGYQNPTPVFQDVACLENKDNKVNFDITVLRQAKQGFFDIAVEFDDVFCSAKLDCKNDEGDPIELLFNGQDRDTTIVVAWACTTGADQDSYLYMDDLVITCDDNTVIQIDPSLGPGNTGGQPPYVFESATYWNHEQLAPYDKCSWNSAIGIDLDAIGLEPGLNCTLTGKATVASQPFDGQTTPENAVYPYIEWNVPIIADGELTCNQHAINQGNGVSTTYTSTTTPASFQHAIQCGADFNPTNVYACSENPGYAGYGAQFQSHEDGSITVEINSTSSPSYTLPSGYKLAGCCADPCLDEVCN